MEELEIGYDDLDDDYDEESEREYRRDYDNQISSFGIYNQRDANRYVAQCLDGCSKEEVEGVVKSFFNITSRKMISTKYAPKVHVQVHGGSNKKVSYSINNTHHIFIYRLLELADICHDFLHSLHLITAFITNNNYVLPDGFLPSYLLQSNITSDFLPFLAHRKTLTFRHQRVPNPLYGIDIMKQFHVQPENYNSMADLVDAQQRSMKSMMGRVSMQSFIPIDIYTCMSTATATGGTRKIVELNQMVQVIAAMRERFGASCKFEIDSSNDQLLLLICAIQNVSNSFYKTYITNPPSDVTNKSILFENVAKDMAVEIMKEEANKIALEHINQMSDKRINEFNQIIDKKLADVYSKVFSNTMADELTQDLANNLAHEYATEFINVADTMDNISNALKKTIAHYNIKDTRWKQYISDANIFDAVEYNKNLPIDTRATGNIFRKECPYQINLKGIVVAPTITSPAIVENQVRVRIYDSQPGIPQFIQYQMGTIPRPRNKVHVVWDKMITDKEATDANSKKAIQQRVVTVSVRPPNVPSFVQNPATFAIVPLRIVSEMFTLPLLYAMKRAGDWGQVEHCLRYKKVFVTSDKLAATYAYYRGIRFIFVRRQESSANVTSTLGSSFVRHTFVLH